MGDRVSDWFERTKTPVSVKFLADRFLAHPMTIREILKKLMEEGRVRRFRKGGTFLYRGV